MILHVNGKALEVPASPETDLLTVLRERLDLTGTRYGCGEGVCGACIVLLEGKAIRSCITPIAALAGKKILTIEGLETGSTLHPVQAAFLETDPFQCSYCASGMIMRTVALLSGNPTPNDEEIITAMNGNICRCGTYPGILNAIKRAIKS